MLDVVGFRVCSGCKIEKPLTREFFYWRTNRKKQRILNTKCINCFQEYKKINYFKLKEAEIKYKENNKEKIKERVNKRPVPDLELINLNK
jgi:hypothetical protein